MAAPSLWERFLCLFKTRPSRPRPRVTVRKTVSIKTRDKDGQQHEYHSLTEAPPELAAEIQKLESEAFREAATGSELTKPGTIRKSVSVFRIRDATGTERIYHSLEEMPPEVRALVEKARDQGKA